LSKEHQCTKTEVYDCQRRKRPDIKLSVLLPNCNEVPDPLADDVECCRPRVDPFNLATAFVKVAIVPDPLGRLSFAVSSS